MSDTYPDWSLFIVQLLLPYTNDNSIGPVIPIEDLSASKCNYSIHFFSHLFYTEETEFLAGYHIEETCPHVLIPPSTIFPVIHVDSQTFFHNLISNHFNRKSYIDLGNFRQKASEN
jgi:hypothetical protein